MSSADLELTVSLLVQIDKLVMLIESPVFLSTSPQIGGTVLMSRFEVAIAGTGQIPIPTEMPLWSAHDLTSVFRLRIIESKIDGCSCGGLCAYST